MTSHNPKANPNMRRFKCVYESHPLYSDELKSKPEQLLQRLIDLSIENRGLPFHVTNGYLAEKVKCATCSVTRYYNLLKKKGYITIQSTKISDGNKCRTHNYITVNFDVLYADLKDKLFEDRMPRAISFMRKIIEVFNSICRAVCTSEKPEEEDLNTNKLGDVSVSDCASPSTESITSNTASVDMEIDDYLIKMDYETCAFAPAVWDKRASAVSSEEVTPHISKILKHNKPYAHVIAALEEKKRLNIPSPGSLERIKESVKNKMDLNMGQDIETAPAKEIHPLRRLLNKRLGFS